MVQIFLKLLNMSITASWIVLAVILLRIILKKAPKWINCILWAIVGVRLILPFSVKSVLSLIPSTETVPKDIVYSQNPEIYTGVYAVNSTVNPIITEAMAPKVEESITPLQIITDIACVVWLCGIAVMILYGVISYLKLFNRTKQGLCIKENIWLCDRVESPFILGVIKPKIILPSDIFEEDIDYVTEHEKAHIKRKDHIWKPLGFALLTVYWFNPVLWIAYILLCRDIELACDEKVIKALGEEAKKNYSNALINCSIHQKLVTACPVAFGEVGVKHRIKSVLNYKKPAFWIIIIALVACIALGVFFLTDPLDKDNTGQKSEQKYFEGIVSSVSSTSVSIDVFPDYRNIVSDSVNISNKSKSGKELPVLKTGDYIRVYYDGVVQEPYPTTVPGVIHITVLGGTGSVLYPDNADVYVYTDSPDMLEPTIRLSKDDNTFTFTYSAFSSYLAVGEYETTDTELVLRTDDGQREYRFKVKNDSLIFDAKNSSEVPQYKYSSDSKPESPVPDKAKFERLGSNYPIIDSISYDIDNDCIKEEVSITYGNTSGIFTFVVNVSDNGKKVYNEMYTYDSCDLKFCENEEDGLQIRAKLYTGDTRYFDAVLENGHVNLYEKGVNIAYLYAQGVNEFSYSREMKEYKGTVNTICIDMHTTVSDIKTAREAILSTHDRVTVSYNRVSVAYDRYTDMWKVNYYTEDTLGADQTIYIASDRATITLIYGE